ncbi:MAG: discoidin domain-containing protein [Candidatus Diapherotrites archaeon]
MKKPALAILLLLLIAAYAQADCSGTANYQDPASATCETNRPTAKVCSDSIDNKNYTEWVGVHKECCPSWIYFDLGAKKCISGVKVYLDYAAPQTQDIQVSDDAANWTTVSGGFTVSEDEKWVEKTFTETNGRYVRLYITSSFYAGISYDGTISEAEIKTRAWFAPTPTPTPTATPTPTPTPATCTDSDGDNIYVKGTTVANSAEYKDYCYNTQTLKEYICSGTTIYLVDRACPQGYSCSDGACVQAATPTPTATPTPSPTATPTPQPCTDSDNGMSFYVKGTTSGVSASGTDNFTNGEYATIEDYCSSNTLGPYVMEHYCSSGYMARTMYYCHDPAPYCIDGKCTSSTPTPTPSQTPTPTQTPSPSQAPTATPTATPTPATSTTPTATATQTPWQGDSSTPTPTPTPKPTPTPEPNLPPVIYPITISPAQPLEEDSVVTFNVSASDPEKQALSIKWYFGDGGISTGSEAEHFFSLAGMQEKEFTVTAEAKDPKGLIATSQAKILVKRKQFTINIIEPKESVEKGSAFPLRIELFKSSGEKISLDKIQGPKVKIEGKTILLNKRQDINVLECVVDSNYAFRTMEEAIFYASVMDKYRWSDINTPFVISFNPAKITAENPFEGITLFPDYLVGKISLRISMPDGSAVQGGEFFAGLKGNDSRLARLKQNAGLFEAELNYLVSEKDTETGLVFFIEGKDLYGNNFEEQVKIPLSKENKTLSIETGSLESNASLTYGQPFSVSVKVGQGDAGEMQNLELKFVIEEFGIEVPLEKKDGTTYEAKITLPDLNAGTKFLNFKVLAESEIGGREVTIMKTGTAMFSSEMRVALAVPAEIEQPLEKIDVEISYANGDPPAFASIGATLSVDKVKETIVLKKTDGNRFSAALPKPISVAEHALELELKGSLTGKANAKIMPKKNENWIGWLFLIAIILGLAYFIRRVLKQLSTPAEAGTSAAAKAPAPKPSAKEKPPEAKPAAETKPGATAKAPPEKPKFSFKLPSLKSILPERKPAIRAEEIRVTEKIPAKKEEAVPEKPAEKPEPEKKPEAKKMPEAEKKEEDVVRGKIEEIPSLKTLKEKEQQEAAAKTPGIVEIKKPEEAPKEKEKTSGWKDILPEEKAGGRKKLSEDEGSEWEELSLTSGKIQTKKVDAERLRQAKKEREEKKE